MAGKLFQRAAAIMLSLAGACCGAVHAQGALDKPVTLVVPFAPGGATDAIGRVIGKKVGEVLGKPVVVDNKPGAGGTIGIDFVARAAPDSNTIVLVNALQHTSSAKLFNDLKYDAIKSFRPLASIGIVRYILLVNAGFEARDYAEFVKLVRSQPGKFSYASAGNGSAPHLAMELFLRTEGLQVVHVPYKGSGPAMTDLAANHVQVAMDNVAAMPLLKAGRLRALAITGERRSPELPDVPTFAEAGQGRFDVVGHWGFLAPAGMPDTTAALLGDAIGQAMKDPAVAAALSQQGVQPEYGSAAHFGATLKSEAEKWAKLIAEAGIRL